jgi:hypothetical protein
MVTYPSNTHSFNACIGFRRFADLIVASSQSHKARIEIWYIVFQHLRSISPWIDAYEHDLNIAASLVWQRSINFGEIRKRRRTDIRTVSESKGEQHQFSMQLTELKGVAVLINEVEIVSFLRGNQGLPVEICLHLPI